MNINQTELLTVAETAAAFSIGRTKLYELLATGKIDAVKLGRRTLVRTASLRDFMDSLPAFRADEL